MTDIAYFFGGIIGSVMDPILLPVYIACGVKLRKCSHAVFASIGYMLVVKIIVDSVIGTRIGSSPSAAAYGFAACGAAVVSSLTFGIKTLSQREHTAPRPAPSPRPVKPKKERVSPPVETPQPNNQFQIIADELKSNRNEALWLESLSKAEGDKDKATFFYTQTRQAELAAEEERCAAEAAQREKDEAEQTRLRQLEQEMRDAYR